MSGSVTSWRHLRRLVLVVAVAALTGCSTPSAETAPPSQAGVTPVDASTAGSIEVQVSYSGALPTPNVLNMSSVPACAAQHPTPAVEPVLVVTDGHLANAVVYIKSGLGERRFAAPTEPVVVNQQGCMYDPHVTAVMLGQPLQFRNSDTEAHNVHGRPRVAAAWNFLMSRPNSTRDVSFDKPEVGIPVGCDIHPWMRAYVSVFDNPYFGVTPRDGLVALRSVPPGDYVVAVWHETLGTLVQPVSVPPSGTATLQVTFRAPE